MQINLKKHNNAIVVELEGEIDLFHSRILKEQFNKLVNANVQKICVDFDKVTYIDSSGVGALLYMFSESRAKALGLVYSGIKGSVRRVIELTKLTNYLPLEDDLQAGLARLEA